MVENKLLLWWSSLALPIFVQSNPLQTWQEKNITKKMQQDPELQTIKKQCDALTREQRHDAAAYLRVKRISATDSRARARSITTGLCCVCLSPFTLIHCAVECLFCGCTKGEYND